MNCPSKKLLPALAASFLIVLPACSGGSKQTGLVPPAFSAAKFTNPATVSNPLFPLVTGTSQLFLGDGDDGPQTTVIEVLPGTRIVQGIPCAVVRDRVYEGGLLIEDTRDWFAQDDARNVWYMGEEVDNYTYDANGNVLTVDHEGAWEAGLDVAGTGKKAQPGFAMLGAPTVGAKYLQEFYPGRAEDTGEVVALDVAVTLGDGTTHRCVQIRDASRLSAGEEFKFYAPGIGKVREQKVGSTDAAELVGRFRPGTAAVPNFAAATFSSPTVLSHPLQQFPLGVASIQFSGTGDGPETIVVERLDEAKTVMGVPCAVVRDRVFFDGLLVEDTRDWYAQDDDGNVWYMGEAVDNYEYDENGNLLSIDHDGSWEAGLDVAGTGSVAQPGFQMKAAPVAGEAYHQEWYPSEATDMAFVVATGVEVELPDGRTFDDCLQTLDWNPLHPDGLEYKFYAPGQGFVLEVVLHDAELVANVGSFTQGVAAVPNFAAAAFANPTAIDHPFFVLPGGATWNYEKETEEGFEEIEVEVLAAPRTVLGIACIEAFYTKQLDGRVMEVARDWYAQDNGGNVWYMGEAVDNYHYAANGTLLNITHEGSWEAGLDIATVGHLAQPGLIMPASPTVGQSHYQEFYRTAAEDMAFVVATGLTLEVDGRTFTGCLQTCDWNPLEPDTLEYKYYAPGVGLVMEHHVGSDEEVSELIGSSLLPN